MIIFLWEDPFKLVYTKNLNAFINLQVHFEDIKYDTERSQVDHLGTSSGATSGACLGIIWGMSGANLGVKILKLVLYHPPLTPSPPVLTSNNLIDNSTRPPLLTFWQDHCCAHAPENPLTLESFHNNPGSESSCDMAWHGTAFTWFWEGGVLGGQGHIPVRIMTIGGMSSKIQWSLKAAPGLHHCTVMPIISLQQNYDNNTRYKRLARLVPICTFGFGKYFSLILRIVLHRNIYFVTCCWLGRW